MLPDGLTGEETMAMTTVQSRLPYLHELDRLRIITALSVVAVHVLALTAFLDTTPLALQVQNAFVMAFHFTREVFMFVTAFALVYVYYGKPFSAKRFWKRRSIGVVLPYVFWSLLYVLVNPHPDSPLLFMRTLLLDLLTGNASYQLYYILLTIEFYLLLPWFLKFLRRVAQHPWITLGLSFALEVAMLYAINNDLQMLPVPGGVLSFLTQFTDRFVLVYQFYFVLGAMVALHLQQVRAFMSRHGAWVFGGMIAALAALGLYYVVETQLEQVSIGSAVAVLQPVMAFYSAAVIAFLYWLAYRRVTRLSQREASRGQRLWHIFSDASFGIYLVHPLFLSATLSLVILHLRSWPVAPLVVFAWLMTAVGATAFTVLLLHVPILSRLVGRERPLRRLSSAWGGKGAILTVLRRREEDSPASSSLQPEYPVARALYQPDHVDSRPMTFANQEANP